MNQEHYYLLMHQQDLFENEVLEEILRERTNAYKLQNKKNNFWILTSPAFVKDIKFQELLKKTSFYKNPNLYTSDTSSRGFYSAIISPNKEFILWLSLRLGYFEDLEKINEFESKNYTSNGIIGKLDQNYNFDQNLIFPKLLVTKYEKLIQLFQNLN